MLNSASTLEVSTLNDILKCISLENYAEKNIEMSHGTHDIAERLRETRQAKGLSQRDLSALTGVPQAQISRIEAGVVDLRLSSLVALANALDLELALVPRKAVPAVRSLSRGIAESHLKGAIATQREMERINDAIRKLQITTPKFDGLEKVRKSFADLQRFKLPVLDLDGLRELRLAMEEMNRPAKQLTAMNKSINLMRTLRNKAAHAPMPDVDDSPPRPAYSLDGEDNDA